MVEGFSKNESEHDGDETKRPWNTVQEHNEALIQNWNSVVRSQDTVYLLGDCFLNNGDDYSELRRLNGKINIILGNHDTWSRVKAYIKLAEEGFVNRVEGYGKIGKNIILSHIPVHTCELEVRFAANIHGHKHGGVKPGNTDPRYFNVSMEAINYTPISYEDIKAKLRARGVTL